jgi:hypothetical protein
MARNFSGNDEATGDFRPSRWRTFIIVVSLCGAAILIGIMMLAVRPVAPTIEVQSSSVDTDNNTYTLVYTLHGADPHRHYIIPAIESGANTGQFHIIQDQPRSYIDDTASTLTGTYFDGGTDPRVVILLANIYDARVITGHHDVGAADGFKTIYERDLRHTIVLRPSTPVRVG